MTRGIAGNEHAMRTCERVVSQTLSTVLRRRQEAFTDEVVSRAMDRRYVRLIKRSMFASIMSFQEHPAQGSQKAAVKSTILMTSTQLGVCKGLDTQAAKRVPKVWEESVQRPHRIAETTGSALPRWVSMMLGRATTAFFDVGGVEQR